MRVPTDIDARITRPGIAIGLAWTPVGGDVLFIEATAMKGKKGLTLTGQLGDVMKESVSAALSFIRTNARELNVDCLLYTSPSPRDRTRSRMPSSA